MNLNDKLSGLFWIVLSILVCMENMRVGIGTFHSPGPGFLPFWAGIALGIFAFILVIRSTLKEKKLKEENNLWIGVKWSKVILLVIYLSIYAFFLQKLGYLIATFGLMTFLFGMIGKTKIWIQCVISLITVLTTYTIFHIWLDVHLPKGIFGF